MIFKTITDSSTGATKSVSLLGNNIANIKNVISSIKTNGLKNTIFNKSTINQDDISKYNAEIRKGIDPQIALSNASANTNKATRALMESANGATVSTDALTAAQKTSTLASRTGQIALKGVALAGNMLAGIGISIIFDKIVESINNYVQRTERAKDSLYDFYNTAKEQQNNLTLQKEWIEQNGSRFSELAGGVDEYGHSISLTKNEIEEYNSLTREIAELFPNMVKGYNDQNQAIVRNKGNVDALTKSYEENIKAYYTSIRSKSGDTFSDYKTAISKSQSTRDKIDSILNTDYHLSIDSVSNWVRNLGDEFDKTTKAQIQDELMKMDKNMFGTNITFRLSDFSEELQQKILDVYSNAQSTIDTETEKVRPILEAFLYSNTSGYDTLDTDAQKAVQNFIRNINGTFYSSFKNDIDLQMWIKKNVIDPLQDGADSSDIAIQFKNIFSLNKSDFDSYQEYINEVQGRLNKLAKATDVKGKKIFSKDQINSMRTQMGISDYNVDGYVSGKKLIQDTKIKFKNIKNSDKYINKLSEDDLHALYYQFKPKDTTSLDEMKSFLKKRHQKNLEKNNQNKLSTTLSFQESWNSLDTTGSDDAKQATQEAKEQLLELAEAGKLTAEELQKSPAGKTIMEQTKLSAEEATEAVNNLADKSSQLSIMESGIQSISSVLAQKEEYKNSKNNKKDGISPETLAGVDDGIKKMDSWKHFEKTLGNGKSSMEDCRKAANKLATEWINSNNFLSGLNKSSEDYYISALKGMGIANAEDVVLSQLIAKGENVTIGKLSLKEATDKVKNAERSSAEETKNNIAQLKQEFGWTNNVATALEILYVKENILNNSSLGADTRVQELKKWAKALLGTATAAEILETAYNAAANASTTGSDTLARQKAFNKAYEKEFNKKLSALGFDKIFNTSDNESDDDNNDPKPPNTPTPTETKQSFDWLERKISVLTSKLDLLKAKIENVFNVQQKNSILDDEIKKTNALINTYKKQEKTYKAQAKKSAKSKKTATDEAKLKLTGKKGKQLIKQIQTGQIKGSKKQWIKAYNAKTANAIEEYQDYWDKYQTAQKNRQDAIKSRRELKIQKHQNWVDYYDSIGSQYDAQIENAATAKAKKNWRKTSSNM